MPIIILTARDSEVDKVVGLELGADDYVTKPFSHRELVARIRAVMRRGAEPEELLSATLEAGPVRMDVERHTVAVDGEPISLPLKEFDLLELLLRNSGRVLTRGQLIDRVWGADYVGDTKTLDVHIKRLRAKIEPDPAQPEVPADRARAGLQVRGLTGQLGSTSRPSYGPARPRRGRPGRAGSSSPAGRAGPAPAASTVAGCGATRPWASRCSHSRASSA